MARAVGTNAITAAKVEGYARKVKALIDFSYCNFMHMKRGLFYYCLFALSMTAAGQRKLTEATLRYRINIVTPTDSNQQELFANAQYVCYLKGVNSRMDLTTSLGKQTTLLLGKTGKTILMKEFGPQRYLTELTPAQWLQLNKRYEDAKLEIVEDTLRMNGFLCRKAIATTTDGSRYIVWFTTELIPVYRDFQLLAKTLPGLLVQYETKIGNTPVVYTLSEINFNPVPLVLFDVPTTGYRLLKFEETGKN
jgi:hypothetical protein